MTRREAEDKAHASGCVVDCVREKYGRNKRRVSYRIVNNVGTVIGDSPVGWKDAFGKAGFISEVK